MESGERSRGQGWVGDSIHYCVLYVERVGKSCDLKQLFQTLSASVSCQENHVVLLCEVHYEAQLKGLCSMDVGLGCFYYVVGPLRPEKTMSHPAYDSLWFYSS